MRRMLLIAALLALVAGDAQASFSPPVELANGAFRLAAVADTDAAGTTTTLISSGSGVLLRERPRGGAWSAPARLPGRPQGVAGPVLDAAGNGALGIAWRVDLPRKYAGVAVALRVPGGALSEPIAIAGPSANGVRHPALSIGPDGAALLAYNTGTRASHLSMLGRIAVAYRRAGGTFSRPVVLDRKLSGAPVVALAPDGTGIVAWSHSGRVYAVSVAAGGRIGRAKAIGTARGLSSLTAAAASGGAATVLWTTRTIRSNLRRHIVAAYRRAGGVFGRERVVGPTTDFAAGARAAADERGRVVIAWRQLGIGGPTGGLTSSIRVVRGTVGRPLGTPRAIARRRVGFVESPSVAIANGRSVVAWVYSANRRQFGVQAAIGSGARQTVASVTLASGFGLTLPIPAATVDPQGPATVIFAQPVEQGNPPSPTLRLLAADGT